jgi:acyl-CoA thioesterase FadM
MNLLLRLLRVLAGVLRARRKLGPLDESAIALRVWPNDLDLNFHMNNGRFLTIMDLGRIDLIGRMGLLGEMRRRGWYPVLSGAVIRYHRPLNLFERFDLRTRIVGWDQRAFVLEQRFERAGLPVATAYVRGVFRGRAGTIAPLEVLQAVGAGELQAPALPEVVRRWAEADELLGSSARGRRAAATAA